MKSKFDIKEMETTQTLSDHPKVCLLREFQQSVYQLLLMKTCILQAIDAVYFQGANKDGLYFIGATARRPHHVINGFVFLRVRASFKSKVDRGKKFEFQNYLKRFQEKDY